MGMNEQCKFCIHQDVCAYKEHYEDAVKLYKKAMEECGKYPWFRCKIECVQYKKGFNDAKRGYQPTQEKPERSDNIITIQNNGNVAQDK